MNKRPHPVRVADGWSDRVQRMLQYFGSAMAMSRETGVSNTAVTAWLNRGSLPRASILRKLAMHPDLDWDWLVSGEGTAPPRTVDIRLTSRDLRIIRNGVGDFRPATRLRADRALAVLGGAG